MAFERRFPFGRELDQRQRPVGALQLRRDLRREAVADVLGDVLWRQAHVAPLGDGLEDDGKVADRDAFREQQTQDGQQQLGRNLGRHEILQQTAVGHGFLG